MSITLALFLLCIVGWMVFRLTIPLAELHRRIFWITVIALAVLPAFTPVAKNPFVQDILWPLLAGLGAGEVLFGVIKKKFPSVGAAPLPAKKKSQRKKKS